MRSPKNIGMALVMMIFLAGCTQTQAQAQSQQSPEERAQRQTEMMTEALDLNASQVAQVEDINMKYSERIADIQAQSGDRRGKFKTMRGMMEEKDAELEAVFTSNQYTIYQEKKAEMRSKMKKRRRERSGS